jgi:hypothetical protein
VLVHVRRSKTDPDGSGQVVGITHANTRPPTPSPRSNVAHPPGPRSRGEGGEKRDLRQAPAVVAAHSYLAGARPGLDIGNHTLIGDYTHNFTALIRKDLYRLAGVAASDIDFAQIYDCFTSTVLMGLEGLGLCERGESGAFVRSGATGLGGALPVNTNGGLLSEGYIHGLNTVVGAVLQIQGRDGERQSARHDIGVVTSGALIDDDEALRTSLREFVEPSALPHVEPYAVVTMCVGGGVGEACVGGSKGRRAGVRGSW